MNIEKLTKKVEALEKRVIRVPAEREFIHSFGEAFHELVRDMVCREIDVIHDSEWFADMKDEFTSKLDKRITDLEEFTGLYNDNEIEDARTTEQIKSDTKKKEEVSSFGCPECGSDNLEFEAWVNEHNDIINYGDQIWCNDCSESVKDIVSKSEYKKEAE
jgi:hypothetical protein